MTTVTLVYCNSEFDLYCNIYSETEFKSVEVQLFESVEFMVIDDLNDLADLISRLNSLDFVGSLADVMGLLL